MRLKKLINDVAAEAKLLQTPTWKDTYMSALTVSFTVFVFALLIMIIDFFSSKVILSIFEL